MPLFFCSVFSPQSRDWVLGNGYYVVIILGLSRIRNAILIMISITFSIICSLAFSLSSRRKHGRQDGWAPGDVGSSQCLPLAHTPPHTHPVLLLWWWGPFATWRGSFLPHQCVSPAFFICLFLTSLLGLAPFFPMKCVLSTPGYCPFNP